jgi:hypothetical protein
MGDAIEFSEALDNACRVSADGVHSFDHGNENEDGDDGDGDEEEDGE